MAARLGILLHGEGADWRAAFDLAQASLALDVSVCLAVHGEAALARLDGQRHPDSARRFDSLALLDLAPVQVVAAHSPCASALTLCRLDSAAAAQLLEQALCWSRHV